MKLKIIYKSAFSNTTDGYKGEVQSANPSTWKAKPEGFLWVQVEDQTGLFREFKVSMNYTERPCLKNLKQQSQKIQIKK